MLRLRRQPLRQASPTAFCRICREGPFNAVQQPYGEGEGESNGNANSSEPLYRPCGCRGSVAHVHASCLARWLRCSRSTNCELCGHAFAVASPSPSTGTAWSKRRAHASPRSIAVAFLIGIVAIGSGSQARQLCLSPSPSPSLSPSPSSSPSSWLSLYASTLVANFLLGCLLSCLTLAVFWMTAAATATANSPSPSASVVDILGLLASAENDATAGPGTWQRRLPRRLACLALANAALLVLCVYLPLQLGRLVLEATSASPTATLATASAGYGLLAVGLALRFGGRRVLATLPPGLALIGIPLACGVGISLSVAYLTNLALAEVSPSPLGYLARLWLLGAVAISVARHLVCLALHRMSIAADASRRSVAQLAAGRLDPFDLYFCLVGDSAAEASRAVALIALLGFLGWAMASPLLACLAAVVFWTFYY